MWYVPLLSKEDQSREKTFTNAMLHIMTETFSRKSRKIEICNRGSLGKQLRNARDLESEDILR